jgi:hypothetical protein
VWLQIDGVHFDCECGEDPGIANAKKFDANALDGFAAHIPLFRAQNKFSIAWHSE